MKTEQEKREKKKKGKRGLVLLSLMLPLAAVIVWLAVWGPEKLTRYRDGKIVNQIQEQETELGTEGYRYSLSGNEKLYILSQCLNHQITSESDQNAMTRTDLDYQYAFVANRTDSSGQEIPERKGIDLCNEGIRTLKELGILPQEVRELTESSYNAVLYSAIEVPEPRNNVLVWKISLSTTVRNANRENRILDAYVDADTGKIYQFYVRTGISSWADVDADNIVSVWAEYVGLLEPQEYENTNPLSENTPYFKKFTFAGMEENNTVVTIGFYEGINELYLKISR